MTELHAAISRRYEQGQQPAQDPALRAAVAHDMSIQRRDQLADEDEETQ
ncbi:hypothetical protein [Streptomyces sp. ISL-100]|nr:hypothetical protein [Streptomyces sp. ISL-100]MBT2397229.1 hypothetical protein [Streptomyces sp. ISL-100]